MYLSTPTDKDLCFKQGVFVGSGVLFLFIGSGEPLPGATIQHALLNNS